MAKANHETKADWQTIAVDSLDQDHQDNWASMKAAYSLYKQAKEEFEAGMRKASGLEGTGNRLVFGYNFGKLSLAVVPDDGKAKAAAKPALGLAEFIAAQQASGHTA
jgi:hypothetical protein